MMGAVAEAPTEKGAEKKPPMNGVRNVKPWLTETVTWEPDPVK
jgi:hypothetical protein